MKQNKCFSSWKYKLKQMDLYVALFAFNVLLIRYSECGAKTNIYDVRDDVTIREGKQTFFSCTVEHFDSNRHVVRWLDDNLQILSKADRFDIDGAVVNDGGDFRSTFTISDVRRTDARSYTCQVYDVINNEEVSVSKPIQLYVLEIPNERYPICDKSSIFEEGVPVEITCLSEKTDPKAKLTWSKNGEELTSNINEGTNNDEQVQTYTFTPTSSDDEASFHCSLKTEADVSLQRNCTLHHIRVRFKPKVTVMGETSFVGKESVFICHITASNPPVDTYKWTTHPFIPSYRYQAGDHTFRLFKPELSDNGTRISCSATNSVGKTFNSTIINVKERSIQPILPTTGTQTDPNGNRQSGTEKSLSYIVFISIGVVLCLLIIMLIPIFYIQCCKNSWDFLGREIVQPDVYFEPKDRILPQLPEGDENVRWMRSIGVQVPQDAELAYIYHEIRENQRSGSSNSSCTRL
ncbi:cell adhesion molecule 4-like [Antedon mediterranea]|uniref:cell adhesion molecule 4-like n=1 Tax=Antedon mediterranea TaxID=105859 RepID=UPI003AF779BC